MNRFQKFLLFIAMMVMLSGCATSNETSNTENETALPEGYGTYETSNGFSFVYPEEVTLEDNLRSKVLVKEEGKEEKNSISITLYPEADPSQGEVVFVLYSKNTDTHTKEFIASFSEDSDCPVQELKPKDLYASASYSFPPGVAFGCLTGEFREYSELPNSLVWVSMEVDTYFNAGLEGIRDSIRPVK